MNSEKKRTILMMTERATSGESLEQMPKARQEIQSENNFSLDK